MNLDIFCPSSSHGLAADGSRELIVGWAGNSSWAGQHLDHKGLKSVIIPAIDKLRRLGYPVRGYYKDREVEWIDHGKMPDYYRQLDVYVCASLHEGTPNPVLEAMACGVPVLSTDVGIVCDVAGPLQRQFIIADRDDPEFFDKLEQLVSDASLRRRLSEENLKSIQSWSSFAKANQWLRFFSRAIDIHSLPGRVHEQWSLLRILYSCGHAHHALSSELHFATTRLEMHPQQVASSNVAKCSFKDILHKGSTLLARVIRSSGKTIRRFKIRFLCY